MASYTDSVSGSHTNSLSNRSESHAGSELEPNEIKGYLMKRTRLSRKWKRVYFVLKNCDLLYYTNPEGTPKKIPLSNADITETSIDKKQFAFCIKSKENGRTYYIHADSELSQNCWMQAICFAKVAGRDGSSSAACVVQ
ncbi:pleckstrin homology domain-containing family H member 2-like [Pomacea canaliculata]|uniref:pleckstrin homology domain-containing family H member 2-like n=1 Tax=Pomacea canaliculata TaxID=400727 RepID=UPI000D73C5C4|nr:pleckstrin homology domain-containing family H member 2-like [Pomacea canaliculata]